jgi:CRISPR-associated endonuclease Csn1
VLKDADKSKKDKHKILQEYLNIKNKKSESDLLDWNEFIKLLCGLEGKLDALFGKEYEGKLSLLSDDSKIAEVLSLLEDEDAIVIQAIKKIVDWSDLANLVGDSQNISSAKVKVYEKHKTDLRTLKDLVKKYSPEKYHDILSSDSSIYATHIKTQDKDILKSLGKKLDFDVTEEDKPILDQIKQDIDNENFLPKQVNITNRTIPYQLYWSELKTLLEKASSYLPFLKSKDESGLSVQDKILSIMEFRVPYFVGPLNSSSPFAWLKRKAEGRILPWNIKDKVDFEASEEEFIKRMLNTCTYLPGCQVLPKQSLLYQKFEVLNAINVIILFIIYY